MSSIVAKSMVRWQFRVALALVVAVGFGVTMLPSQVSAQNSPGNCTGLKHAGRVDCHGFFTNQLVDIPSEGTEVIAPPALDSVVGAKDYIQLMGQYLNSSDPQEHTSAAFTIAIMLGEPSKNFGGSTANGVAWAKANFNRWTNVINYYDANNLIDWNVHWSTFTPYQDSGYGRNMQDNYYVTYEPTSADLIVFRMPPGYAGAPFRIDRSCANIQGDDKPLPYPPGNNTGDINPPTPPSGSNPPGYVPPSSPDPKSDTRSSCQTITGHAFDASKPAYAVKVNLTYSISGGPTINDTTNALTTGNHPYSKATPAAVQNSVTQVTVSAVGIAADGTTKISMTNSPIKLGPCLLPAPNCDGFTISPTDLDPDTPYKITASVDYGNAAVRALVLAQPNTKFFVTVKGPGLNKTTTSTNIAQLVPYGVGGLRFTTPQQAQIGQTGKYVVGWGISGSYGAVNCGDAVAVPTTPPPFFTVTKKPYFQVNGGDVSAGAGMSTGGVDCSASGGVAANDKAGIVSWNKGGPSYGGAGTAYAAFALGHLQDFATGQGNALAPSGAAFGNTGGDSDQVDLTRGLFGGEFGSASCTADYFANATGVLVGDQNIPGQVIPLGLHKTIYVKGDVYIKGNITFAGATTGYPSLSEIPSFAIVVQGNIYIDPSVTQLDGFYIAQPPNSVSAKGVIYTCDNPFNETLQAKCGNPLTVNGGFVGRQIWLLRTAGSINSTPAETFNYVPDLWLSTPFGSGLSPATDDSYDAITSLPPVL